ncbi:Diamine acetyltransferase 2 [Trichostrongylus colubriformis]|uniref:Diamine acetyltransferase 2 n=1 Tax=Trichostrongylus colubriformis TaxID=6319 RepID=A0AAN8EMK6_TRICO
MMSTCILPYMEATGCTQDSPHIRLKFYIDLSWIFSTCIGLLLFLVEIGIIFFVKFTSVDYAIAGYITTAMLIPVVVVFVIFSYLIHRSRVSHTLGRFKDKVMAVSVTRATPADAPILMSMVRELADFEKMPEAVKIDDARLAADLEKKSVDGFVLHEGDEPAAMLLFYYAYSTWEGQYIHMEDLYVRPQFRRKGYGRLLWRELAMLAKRSQVERLQWNVLDWNSNAIAFYETLPCENLSKKEGWLLYRLDADGIAALAEKKTAAR